MALVIREAALIGQVLMNNSKVMFSSKSDEWATPDGLYETLHAEFDFNVDGAATASNSRCTFYYCLDWVDALKQSWSTDSRWIIKPTVWLNPPYSQCYEFIAKAAEEARNGCTVVCLVPSRTDTRWFHDYVWDRETHQPQPGVEVRFLKGRLKFGGAKAGAPFPSMIVIFSPPPCRD